MADGTKIEWTDMTWNVVNGCSVVSPGCKHCYAMKQAHRFPVRQGLTERTAGGMVWTGEVRFNEKVLLEPLRLKRPRRIFVCAHGDLFHENVPDEWIDRVFAVMALAKQHAFQVLTKRPERMRAYVNAQSRGNRHVTDHVDLWQNKGLIKPVIRDWIGSPDTPRPLPNVWLGTSVEDQKRADERIPILLETPAAVRWLSCEPLLGPVDLSRIEYERTYGTGLMDCLGGDRYGHGPNPMNLGYSDATIDWVVAGGESGPGARPMHPDWARSLRDQCAGAGVAFLFKQWGNFAEATMHNVDHGDVRFVEADGSDSTHWTMDRHSATTECLVNVGKKAAGRLLDGIAHNGYPA